MFYETKEIIENNLIYEFKGERTRESCFAGLDNIWVCISEYSRKRRLIGLVSDLFRIIEYSSDYGKIKGNSIFMIGKSEKSYLLYYMEIVNKVKSHKFEEAIALINNKSIDQLKELYKEILTDPELTFRPKIPLHLIEMKRRSNNNILYIKHELDEDDYYFEFIIRFS